MINDKKQIKKEMNKYFIIFSFLSNKYHTHKEKIPKRKQNNEFFKDTKALFDNKELVIKIIQKIKKNLK